MGIFSHGLVARSFEVSLFTTHFLATCTIAMGKRCFPRPVLHGAQISATSEALKLERVSLMQQMPNAISPSWLQNKPLILNHLVDVSVICQETKSYFI